MAAAGFTPPTMNWQASDINEELATFKQYCNLVFHGPFSKKNNSEKSSYILLWIGRQGVDIYNGFTWDNEDDKTKPSAIWSKFEKHLAPRTNFRLARYQLQQLKQTNEETVDDFMTKCRNQAAKCKFRDQREIDERLIEQLIVGTKHKKAQERILEHGDELTLDKALDYARTYEATITHVAQLNNPDTHVNAIGKSETPKRKCGNCGRAHEIRKCPAYGSICNFCSKPNHWSNVCRQKANSNNFVEANQSRSTKVPQGQITDPQPRRRNRHVHELQAGNELSDEFEMLHFESITVDSITPETTRDEALVTLDLSLPHKTNPRIQLKGKLDTGAQANILPIRLYREMFPQNISSDGQPKHKALKASKTVLTAYGGSRINQFGTCEIECKHEGYTTKALFYVTDAPGRAIIGLPTALTLKLITLNCSVEQHAQNEAATHNKTTSSDPITPKEKLIQQFPECFDGIGKFEGEYHITLDPNVPPVIHAPRRVPISMKDDIKRELDEMISQGIIAKVREGEPTSWVNSLVYRRKPNGRLRICLDPKDLNAAIKRDHHVTPTLEEILPKLSGAKHFSILDAKCGYWNVVLDNDSSYLTTFNSPFGRYRFLRMPFGLKMSQDVFQSKIDQTFEGCSGVTGIADDIVVSGTTEEEHNRNLHGMIMRCQTTGLKLNPDKCYINQDKIKFYGIICSGDGIQPDPAKVSALKQMKEPTDQKELQTFLGLATYMSPFIANLSILTAPLRELLKEGTTFQWNANYQTAFNQIKESISEKVTLTYFNDNKEVTLQVDASMKGLGAALLQEGKPVAFASKSLTDAETRYANIERELLAVVYGCERFHIYLFGSPFTVLTDHKPLESIHLKHLTSAPPRLQRMLLRLQPYDIKIRYIPGKEMLLADALSRLSPEEKFQIENEEIQVHEIYTQFSNGMIEKIRSSTTADEELSCLKHTVYEGWPETIKEVSKLLKPYWSFRDEITIDDGILTKGQRIIIPAVLQKEILAKLHASHQGAEKTKLRARTSVYWRNMNDDIDKITATCQTCQTYQPSNAKQPLIPTEVPPRPWHTIATDLFCIDNSEYLLISDYYSKYPFVRKIPKGQSNSRTVIEIMKQIFSEQGIPKIVRSDNGPHYSSANFQEFAKNYGFEHVTSSPRYPQANGFIENQVKTVKATLLKTRHTGEDPCMALLCLRTTPIDNKLPSPSELLLGRKIQGNLPSLITRGDNDDVVERLKERQDLQKFYFDQNTRVLPDLLPGQSINIQNPSTRRWEPATIKEKLELPRSYTVVTSSGGELRRNRSHIRETTSSPPKQSQPMTISKSPEDCSSAKDTQPTTPPGTKVTRSGRIVQPPDRFV